MSYPQEAAITGARRARHASHGGHRCVLRCQAFFALQSIPLSEGGWVTPESGCEQAFSSCSALDGSSDPLRASLR